MDIIFPSDKRQRYYKTHYQYVLDLLKSDTYSTVTFEQTLELSDTSFSCLIDRKPVLFDFGDSSDFQDLPYIQFKFHQVDKRDNVFPFPPVSFYDWAGYTSLSSDTKGIVYECNTDTILFNQRSYADASARRDLVRDKLCSHFGNSVDTSITDQMQYFKKIENCLVSVHVPGYCNNMIDRAQLQLIGLGCCTISPNLPELFPYYQKLEPGIHYIQCEDDYSDLIDKIEWCKENRDECIEIGHQAKTFFEDHCKPTRIIDWMKKCLNII